MVDPPPVAPVRALLASLFAPAALAVLAVAIVVSLVVRPVWVLPEGFIVYALVVSDRYRRLTGRVSARPSKPAKPTLQPQYRSWTDHADNVCAALRDTVDQCDQGTRYLVDPIRQKAEAMAAKLADLAAEADRLYRYLLAADPRQLGATVDLQSGAMAQQRLESRRQIVELHERIVATAREVLDAMDAVQAQALRLAAGTVTGEDGTVAEAVSQLDSMRATADALEEVVARTQAQTASQ